MVADEKLSKGAMKLLLNLALIAGDALVRGGRLDVGAETTRRRARNRDPGRGAAGHARRRLARHAYQRRARPTAQIEPRAAGAWLAKALAAEAGGTIQLSEPAPEILIIGASFPS